MQQAVGRLQVTPLEITLKYNEHMLALAVHKESKRNVAVFALVLLVPVNQTCSKGSD